MKTIATLYIGLAAGTVLGGIGGATYLAIASAREGVAFDPIDLFIFVPVGMPVGAAFGGLLGAFVGILRENKKP
jgi:ABC-type uncharacterized transport system permease subunit